jgi:peptidoglycan/xylan/chitin deacetylase (PgdA/CDA1 family)
MPAVAQPSGGVGVINGAPHSVCLSVDFDGMAIWLQFDPELSPTKLARAEYAGKFGLPSMLDLFAAEEVPSTVFVPGHTVEMFSEVCLRARDEGHELAHHGYLHKYPTGLTEAQERVEFERGMASHQTVLGLTPRGYRAPGGDLSRNSIGLATEFGLDYDTSSCGRDYYPYYARLGDSWVPDGPVVLGAAVDMVEIPSLSSMVDVPQMEFLVSPPMPGLHAYEKITRMWCDELDWMLESTESGVLTLVLHPSTAPKGARLRVLRDFIHHAKDRGVAFSRMGDIADTYRGLHPYEGKHLMS